MAVTNDHFKTALGIRCMPPPLRATVCQVLQASPAHVQEAVRALDRLQDAPSFTCASCYAGSACSSNMLQPSVGLLVWDAPHMVFCISALSSGALLCTMLQQPVGAARDSGGGAQREHGTTLAAWRSVKRELQEVVQYPVEHPEKFEKFGMSPSKGGAGSTGPPR